MANCKVRVKENSPSYRDVLYRADAMEAYNASAKYESSSSGEDEPVKAEGATVRWIRELNFIGHGLRELPALISHYHFCFALNLSGNNLVDVGPLHQLRRLKRLDLSCNRLKNLPEQCYSMFTLLHVDVSHNCLTNLPDWVFGLENVEYLNLSRNSLHQCCPLSFHAAKWKQIKVCRIECCRLLCVPKCLASCPVVELHAGNIESCEKDATICRGTRIINSRNRLWVTPDCLPKSLKFLKLNDVTLANADSNWDDLTSLEHLDISGNGVSSPPENLTSLFNLKHLDMSQNRIFMFPPNLSYLTSLCAANLSHNQLVTMPQSLQDLQNLERLDLYGNRIEECLCDLSKLPRLTELDLWNNFIDPLPLVADYDQKCQQLRQTLPHDLERDSKIRPTVHIDDDVDAERCHLCDYDRMIECRHCSKPNETSESSDDEGIGKQFGSCDVTEENWDESVFSTDEEEEDNNDHAKTTAELRLQLTQKEHFFLPALWHTPSHSVKAGLSTPARPVVVIPGQFDDDDD